MELSFVENNIRNILINFTGNPIIENNSLLDEICIDESDLVDLENETRSDNLSKSDIFRLYLLQVLEDLRNQKNTENMACVLYHRFIDGLTVKETKNACELHMADGVFFDLQNRAIKYVAQIILSHHNQKVERRDPNPRIPSTTYEKLFGIEENFERLKGYLHDDRNHWFTMLVGMGGVGKTALVREYVEQIGIGTCHYNGVVWATAQRRRLFGGIQPEVNLDLTLGNLLDTLVGQLGYPDMRYKPQSQKKQFVHKLLKSNRYLIVFDNLETADDIEPIADTLRDFCNPTKVLLTSRINLNRDFPITSVEINGLNEHDTIEFAKYRADQKSLNLQNVTEDTLKKLYEVTRGNPLYIIFIVNQLRNKDLESTLDSMKNSDEEADIGYFLFSRLWELLSENARNLLYIMAGSRLTQGEKADVILISSGLNQPDFDKALAELIDFSLVIVNRNTQPYLYSLHPLVITFVLNKRTGDSNA